MKIVLFDRDGTLIVDPPDLRVDSVEEIELFPDTIQALRYLAQNDFNIIIISNQAGIAEGRITEKELWNIHQAFLQMLVPSGIKVLKTYMNAEASGTVSQWRKPGPGMLIQAAKDFDLDLAGKYMVGDRLSDIQSGINAGTKTILVKTANDNVDAPEATYTAEDLMKAVQYIVAN